MTSRFDEGILQPENFTKPEVAVNDDYPKGAFGYTQTYPMVLKFVRPVKLISVYLKKHRDPNFFRKVSAKKSIVRAYLDDALTLNVSIVAYNDAWKLYYP